MMKLLFIIWMVFASLPLSANISNPLSDERGGRGKVMPREQATHFCCLLMNDGESIMPLSVHARRVLEPSNSLSSEQLFVDFLMREDNWQTLRLFPHRQDDGNVDTDDNDPVTPVAKAKKRTAKKIRMEIRRQLEHVRRDLGYLAAYMGEGYALPDKYVDYYLTILKLYEQQKYMYDNKTHQVSDRIVSISQPYIRPIVRGKAKAPVEFGAKYDVSVDEKGHVRLEKVSFTPYNECTIFVDAIERYYKRTGHYPERVLVDQIYRTRENRKYCKDHGIRMSGPKLGRPKANEPKQTKQEYQDNVDRIEVERFFSVDKRCSGAGLIMTKLEETSLCSIALSVFVTNLFAIPIAPYFLLFFWDDGCNYGKCHFLWIEEAV